MSSNVQQLSEDGDCCRGSNSTPVTCAYALWWLSDLGHGLSGELLRKIYRRMRTRTLRCFES